MGKIAVPLVVVVTLLLSCYYWFHWSTTNLEAEKKKSDVRHAQLLNTLTGLQAELRLLRHTVDNRQEASRTPITSFFGIHFSGPFHGWLVGERGSIFATVNGGESWHRQATDVDVALKSVWFDWHNKDVGYVVGDKKTILHTEDGGKTWTKQNVTSEDSTRKSLDLHSVSFWTLAEGCAVGDWGSIVCTTDSGNNWTEVKVGNGDDLSSVSVFYNDPVLGIDQGYNNFGWAVSYDGYLYTSSNRGKSWVTSGPWRDNWGFDLRPRCIRIIGGGNGCVVGGKGGISITNDGAKTWTDYSTGNLGLNDVDWEYKQWWAVGEGGAILTTADMGKTWAKKSSGVLDTLHCVCFPTIRDGWAAGAEGTVVATTDGGDTWVKATMGDDVIIRTQLQRGTSLSQPN